MSRAGGPRSAPAVAQRLQLRRPGRRGAVTAAGGRLRGTRERLAVC